MTTFHLDNVKLTAKRTWLIAFGMSFSLLPFLLLFAAQNIFPHAHDVVFGLVALSLVGSAMNVASRYWTIKRAGRLEIDATSIKVDGHLIDRSSIRDAFEFQDGERVGVRMTRPRRFPVDLSLAAPGDASKVVLALGKSAQQATATFRVFLGWQRRVQLTLALLFFVPAAAVAYLFAGSMRQLDAQTAAARELIRLHGREPGFQTPVLHDTSLVPMMIFAILAVLVPIVGLYVRRAKLTVGADGFALQPSLGKKRFVRYRDLTDATADGVDVQLSIAGDRKPLRLSCGGGSKKLHGAEIEIAANAIARRLNEGRARMDAPHAGASRALVAPGGRSVAAWMHDMLRLGDDVASLRSSALPPDELWQLLADPQEDASLRAGSALALRRRLDGEGRARVRLIAEACAAPPLKRILLATANDADGSADAERERDDELAAALEELEAEDAKARMRRQTS